jgi:hypothetical protein
VQARFVDDAGLQECDEGAALLRLVVEASGGAKCKNNTRRNRKNAAPQQYL